MALCDDFLYPVYRNTSLNMQATGRNSLTPFSIVQVVLSRFSRNARLLDTVLVQNWSTEFHENRTN